MIAWQTCGAEAEQFIDVNAWRVVSNDTYFHANFSVHCSDVVCRERVSMDDSRRAANTHSQNKEKNENMEKHSKSISLPDKWWCVVLCFLLLAMRVCVFLSSDSHFSVRSWVLVYRRPKSTTTGSYWIIQRQSCSPPFEKAMTFPCWRWYWQLGFVGFAIQRPTQWPVCLGVRCACMFCTSNWVICLMADI